MLWCNKLQKLPTKEDMMAQKYRVVAGPCTTVLPGAPDTSNSADLVHAVVSGGDCTALNEVLGCGWELAEVLTCKHGATMCVTFLVRKEEE